MRIANLRGRLTLLAADRAIDVAEQSDGRFGPDPQAVWNTWDAFRDWASSARGVVGADYDPRDLGPPVPKPAQVFAIGLNYRDHAEESGLPVPSHPTTFTKFPSCITGPFAEVALPSEKVDWEVELVFVIGKTAHQVPAADAWSHVAGFMVGQDLSEREVQLRPPVPQFPLGKSFPGFGPIGPAVVTLDEISNPDDLELGCKIGDEIVQRSRTSQMIFPVAELVARLSAIVTLWPGDLVFTGTPQGVGMGRKPPRWLRPGDVLESWIEGVGTIRQTLVGRRSR